MKRKQGAAVTNHLGTLPAAMADANQRSLRILVVEDDFLVGLQLEQDLRAAGHIVVGPYGSLASATEAARREAFDLAILDVNLRGLAVFPLADELLARDLPVILLTGYQRADLPERFRGTTHLPKPYDPQALARELDKLGAS